MYETYTDDQIRQLSPEHVVEFLVRKGWTFQEPFGDYGYVYASPSGEEVFVPIRQQARGYPLRLRELLEMVADEQDVAVDLVFQEILSDRRDIIRFQATTGEGQRLIGVEDLPGLTLGARTVIKDVVQASPIEDNEREQYLQAAKFSLSESNSYGVTMFSPPIPVEAQHRLASTEVEPSSVRKVTHAFCRSIRAARQAINDLRDGKDDVFTNASDRGIRVKTCEGLTQMIGTFEAINCHVEQSHLPSSPLQSTVSFTHSDVEYLEQVTHNLRRQAYLEEMSALWRLVSRKLDDITDELTVDRASSEVQATLDRDASLLPHGGKQEIEATVLRLALLDAIEAPLPNRRQIQGTNRERPIYVPLSRELPLPNRSLIDKI